MCVYVLLTKLILYRVQSAKTPVVSVVARAASRFRSPRS